jgi:hypothetical protein
MTTANLNIPRVLEEDSRFYVVAGRSVRCMMLDSQRVDESLGMCSTLRDQINAELLVFFKQRLRTSEGNTQVLIPVRELAVWIETNVLLQLSSTPFDKQDEMLVSGAGSCANCPKRTGLNQLLFADVRKDSCKLYGIGFWGWGAVQVTLPPADRPSMFSSWHKSPAQPDGGGELREAQRRRREAESEARPPRNKNSAAAPTAL